MNDAKVTVNVYCQRLHRAVPTEMSIVEAQRYYELQDRRVAAADKISKTLGDLQDDVKPDLIIFYEGQAHVLHTISPKAREGLKKALNEALNEEAYTHTPKKRAKRGTSNQVTSTSEPSHEGGEATLDA